MSQLEFHELRVTEVTPLTDDAVAVTFDVPPELETTFDFIPGQHVTVRTHLDDVDVRRSYSICAPAGSGKLRVGVKRLRGGLFSTYATEGLEAGDVLEVMPPVGEFTIEIDPTSPRTVTTFARGRATISRSSTTSGSTRLSLSATPSRGRS